MAKLSRRMFLMMTGGTGAAMMIKPGEQFFKKLIPYFNPPVYPKPGEWAYFSTTCRECPAGCGLLMWHRDGRVTKADGNPLHSINQGKLCIRGQSTVQGQYNPDRFTKVLKKYKEGFKEQTWEVALATIRDELKAGNKAHVLSDLQTGSLAEVMTQFTGTYGSNGPLFYEPFNYESLRLANKEMYGEDLLPRYDISGSDLIVSFNAGFLDTWLSPVEYAHDFKRTEEEFAKSIFVGPAETLTAVNADEFILASPASQLDIVYGVIHALSRKGRLSKYNIDALPVSSGKHNDSIEKISNHIIKSKSPVILAGSPEDSSQQGINIVKAVNLLNELLGNRSRIDFSQYHAISDTAYKKDVVRFFQSLTSNDILIIHRTNPAYSMPHIAEYLKKAGMVVYIGSEFNETCDYANWILPAHYPLEDWGDYEPWKGTVSLMQPVMKSLHDTKSAGDIFLGLMEASPDMTFKGRVRYNWKYRYSDQDKKTEETAEFYRNLLQSATIVYSVDKIYPEIKALSFSKKEDSKTEGFLLHTYPSLFFYDGRLSNRPWLQEISHPISNIAWQSWLDMHPQDALKLNIEEGDIVKVSAGSSSIEIAVRLTNKVVENTVALEIGQGHWGMGKTADQVGTNAFSLLAASSELPYVKIEKTKEKQPLLYLNATKDQHEREVIMEVSFEELQNGFAKEEITWPTSKGYFKEKDLYKHHDHKKHRWGMIIDLQACIGCKACEAACYAENNIPVVGKENCRGGKEMSWLKVVPYNIHNNKTAFIPLPCQHCDAAPCEPVCPVFASVHTEEGLNAQIYNRCVGTRYCSNNCPYKVRRFNWSNLKHDYPMNLQLNPEVTVRERGVMEKCTFCIQRIRNAQDRAKIEKRTLKDGDIMTACQQTCPTGAIVFGDLHDETANVTRLMEHERRYQLLHELNTKPAVVYLKKINREM